MNDGVLDNLYGGNMGAAFFPPSISYEVSSKVKDITDKTNTILEKYPPHSLEKGEGIPLPLLDSLSRLGVFGLSIPEEYDGLGMSLSEYLHFIRIMSKKDLGLLITPLAHLSIGLKAILLFGSDDQKSRYLPPAARGEMIFSYCLTEPKTGSDARHIETSAKLSSDGSYYILNGTKTFITNGGIAKGLTVFARLDSESNSPPLVALIVETGWDGVHAGGEMPKMGLKASSTTSITFKDVNVPVTNRIGREGDGFKIAMQVLNYGRLGLGAAGTGLMEVSARDMRYRATHRIQFEQKIIEFPLIQEKILKAEVDGFISFNMTFYTAALLEKNPLGLIPMESSHTKLFATHRGWLTLYEALQVAGGAGYLSSLPYEKRMRDFRVTTVFEGTTEIHSLYPALFLANGLGKRLKAKGLMGKFLILYFGSSGIKLPRFSGTGVSREGSKLMKILAGQINRNIRIAVRVHRKAIVNEEFLLRRISWMSLYFYAILVSLIRIDQGNLTGKEREQAEALLLVFYREIKHKLPELRSFRDQNMEEAVKDYFSSS